MTLPADEISLHDLEHVTWLKEQADPVLWHVAAMSGLTYGDPYAFILWAIGQEQVDRATAGFVFLGRYGVEWLVGEPELGGEGLSGVELEAVFEAICRRSASRGFSSDDLGLAPGFEGTRLQCLDAIREGRVAPGRDVPTALVEAPFPPERPLGYVVEDGWIYEA